MVKKSYILPLMLVLILVGFLFNVFNAGNRHVTVVGANVKLKTENVKLNTENKILKTENTQLKVENNALSTKLDDITSNPTTTLPKAIIQIEMDVHERIGWTTPEMAYDLLKEKLNRTPTRTEIQISFTKLIQRDLLYYPGNPDPYMRGDKVQYDEVNEILNQLVK